MGQTKRHGTDLSCRKTCDKPLHLVSDAPHELSHRRAVHTAQVQLLLQGAAESLSYFVLMKLKMHHILEIPGMKPTIFALPDLMLNHKPSTTK